MDLLYSPITLFVLILMVIVWQGFLTFLVWKHISFYQRLTKDATGSNLIDVLSKVLHDITSSQSRQDEFSKRLQLFETKIPLAIQRVGLVKFNPYNEVSGDQSFTLALLDEGGEGIVVTSLHSRSQTRIYAKAVSSNEAAQSQLSHEEKEAIQKASASHGTKH